MGEGNWPLFNQPGLYKDACWKQSRQGTWYFYASVLHFVNSLYFTQSTIFFLVVHVCCIDFLYVFHLFSFYCTIAKCRCSVWQESERAVTKKEGIEFAREYGCLFLECSAKTKVNVEQCFEELVLKVCDDFSAFDLLRVWFILHNMLDCENR